MAERTELLTGMDSDDNLHARVQTPEDDAAGMIVDDGDEDENGWTTDSDTNTNSSDAIKLENLDMKITSFKEQLASTSSQPTEPGKPQSELGDCYLERYETSDQPEDIETALTFYNNAVALAPGEPTYLLGLGICHNTHYQISGGISGLKSALGFLHAAVDTTTVGDPDLPVRMQALAATYRNYFRKTNELEAIQSAITWDQRAVDKILLGHLEAPDHYQSLALSYEAKYERFGDVGDLENSLQCNQAAVLKMPEDHPKPSDYHNTLAESYRERFRRLGNIGDIDSALHHHQIAILAGAEDPAITNFQKCLAISYRDRFQAIGDLKDLEAALKNDYEAVAGTAEGDPELPYYLQSLAASCVEKFRRFNDLNALHFALEYSKEASAKVPKEDEDYPEFQAQLGVSYLCLYEALGASNYLILATQCFIEAKTKTPAWHLGLANLYQYLGICHRCLFQSLGDAADLKLSMEYNTLALNGTPPGHPEHSEAHQNLALTYQDQYQTTGNVDDLQASLDHGHSALRVAPPNSPNIPEYLCSLAKGYSLHFQRFKEANNLDCALEFIQEAVRKIKSTEHAEYPDIMLGLAEVHVAQFSRTGELESLESAINSFHAALKKTKRSSLIVSCKGGLAISLLYRFIKLNNFNDLQTALEYGNSAIAAAHDNSPQLVGQKYVLAMIYHACYERFGNLEDLEAAIEHGKAAVQDTAPGNPELQGYQKLLSTYYTSRFLNLNNPHDLTMALHYDQVAVTGTPRDHPDMPIYLQSLGVSYTNKFLISKDIKDVENALNYKHAAMKAAQNNLSDFSVLQSSLAFSYLDQFYTEGDPEDLHCALFYLRSSATVLSSKKPQDQWDTALRWAYNAYHHELPECVEAFSVAFSLLPDLLWIGNPVLARHASLLHYDIPTVTMWAVSACIRFKKITLAIELLEQGLAITHQQQLQLKDEFTVLHEKHPLIAKELKDMSHQLQEIVETEEEGVSSVQTLAFRRQNLIKQIRKTLSGLQDFLLPTRFQTLASAAKNGPVVLLNCTTVGSDAIIILPQTGEHLHIALPNVTKSGAETQLRNMRDTLRKIGIYSRNDHGSEGASAASDEDTSSPAAWQAVFDSITTWLWENVVSLIFRALRSKNITKGRIWWCATGPFTYLPLHAAPPLHDDLFDHSYTPTLSALVKANEKFTTCTQAQVAGPKATLTFVGVPELPGRPDRNLPSVPLELARISSVVGAERVDAIVGEAATTTAVFSALSSSKWLHLACHGEQDVSEPLQSHLVLYDGKLTLGEILNTHIPDAGFVFLSACETAMGDAGLINESMHLAGGMIFAGFCGALGTMWSIVDSDGPPLADFVYKRVFGEEKTPDVRDVARALHIAIRAMRRKGLPFQRWAPFVHMGV